MAMKLNEILAGAPLLRRKAIEIEGLGEIEVRELSAAEQWAMMDDQKRVEGDNSDELVRVIFPRWAVVALTEPGEPVKDGDPERLASVLGSKAIIEIVKTAANFDGVTSEDARKNSSSDRISDSDSD